jgi:HlyD family secretion protein
MEITPDNEKLIIDARIPQSKIAYVHTGLDAVIRFSAFKSRTSPSFKGKIVAMSTDAIEDQKSLQMLHTKGMSDDASFYPAKIEIDMDDFNRLAKGKNLKLQTGMRAEIMIITGKRTLLRYLLDPITDTAFKALKEK